MFTSDLSVTGNLIEAGLWFCISAVMAAKWLHAPQQLRTTFALLAISFLIFGVSDLIESRTGAWWRPWWLLVMKGACLVMLALGFFRYYQLQRAAPRS
jgi:hypothetical protein